MKKIIITVLIVIPLVGLAWQTQAAGAIPDGNNKISISLSSTNYLVNSNGMTLYTFLNDTSNHSNCYGACAQKWPPATSVGLNGSVSGTIRSTIRTTGTSQLSYNGRPLYTYSGDAAPGDTNGDGINNVWFVASTSNTPPPVSGVPVAYGQNISVPQNSGQSITLTGHDSNGANLTYVLFSGTSHGTISGRAPNLTYTPKTDFNGLDSFMFKVYNGTNFSALAMVNITVGSGVVSTDTPIANSQSVSMTENGSQPITLSGSDLNNAALTYSIVTNPSNGSLNGSVPNLTYTPNQGFIGMDSFTFKVNNGIMDSNISTVTISVGISSNTNVPTAYNINVTTPQGTALGITLTATDPQNLPLNYSVIMGPFDGMLTGTAPNLVYVPNSSFTGRDSLTFKVNNGISDSAPATVNITVGSVSGATNHITTAYSQNITVGENSSIGITLTGNDSLGLPLSYSILSNPTHGNLTGSAPLLVYTPDSSFSGLDTITFKVTSSNVDSAPATININVVSNGGGGY